MDSYYAPAGRVDADTLKAEIEIVAGSTVFSGLLQTVNGLVAVVNEQRQVIAFNDLLLSTLGVEDPGKVLGLRPGEILSCEHAEDEPAGCGTTKFCSTCGAAVAMVTSLDSDACTERLCALKTNRNGVTSEAALMVRSQPIFIDKRRFLLLFLQDVSRQETHAALERTFFHDIRNTLQIIVGTSDLLMDESPSDDICTIQKTAERLINEVALQRRLIEGVNANYKAAKESINGAELLGECQNEMSKHPAAVGKSVVVVVSGVAANVMTDRAVVLRILSNMIINALEATPVGGTVKLSMEDNGSGIVYSVWNSGVIAPDVAQRIFQRHFSTKNQPGRGIGTYSMKLFGEQFLGGRVSFSSSENEGTVFRLSLPV